MVENQTNKFFLEADISVIDSPSKDLISKAYASDVLSLSKIKRQPDLLYSKAIFVSTGENKNGAYFIPYELYKAKNSIVNKPLDIEHDEQTIVGHIIDYAFMSQDGHQFDPDSTVNKLGENDFNSTNFDIGIVGVMHKVRFPELASEILKGEYGVSMEVLYGDYHIKVGDIIVPKEQAVRSGLIKMVGQHVHITHASKPIRNNNKTDRILKVFKDMFFYGCGFTKRPANTRSVIMESASENLDMIDKLDTFDVKGIPVFDQYVYEANKMSILPLKKEHADTIVEDMMEEDMELSRPILEKIADNDTSQCISFKRHVYDRNSQEAGAKVIAENWCALFDDACPVAGSATDPACYRSVFGRTVIDTVTSKFDVLLRERQKKAAQLIGIPVPEEKEVRVHNPGNTYDINQVRTEITSNNVGEPLEKLIRHSESAIASLDASMVEADKILEKYKNIKS